jgi:hypothetical protein
MDNHTAQAENTGMFCGIMLDNAFKAIELGIVFAPVAKEKLLLKLFSQGFDLCVKYPLHVLQNEFSGGRRIGRILLYCFARGTSKSIFLRYIIIEPVSNVH